MAKVCVERLTEAFPCQYVKKATFLRKVCPIRQFFQCLDVESYSNPINSPPPLLNGDPGGIVCLFVCLGGIVMIFAIKLPLRKWIDSSFFLQAK